MPASIPSDDSTDLSGLMTQVSAHSQPAFAELYTRTHHLVYGTALRLIRSPDHAADVCQDVYVQVWNQADSSDAARGTVLTWLATISRRRAVDRIRYLARASTRDQKYASVHQGAEADTVWERVELNLDIASLRTALTTLSSVQRQALELAYIGPGVCTHVQIAEVLGLPLGTVKSRIRDGLISLRTNLAT